MHEVPRDLLEGAVAVVSVHAITGSLRLGRIEIPALNEINIQISVAVVVEQSDSPGHVFRKIIPLLERGNVFEIDIRRSRDFFEPCPRLSLHPLVL